jgi:multidrug efflux pump subunit AcrA (membrane-fusion protein)
MKKIIKTVFILVLIGLVAFIAITKLKEKREHNQNVPLATNYPIIVDKFIPKKSHIALTLPYLAISENESDAKLSSRIAARVEMIKKSGTVVNKDEVLIKLDTTDLQSKLKAQKIELKNMQLTHKRTLDLYKVKGASIEQLQKEESKLAAIKAQIKVLQNQLAYATIKSPQNGTISKTFVSIGDMAMPGKPLMQISANNDFSLIIRVPHDIKPKAIIFNNHKYKLLNLHKTFHSLDEYKACINDNSITAGDRFEVDVVLYDANGVLLPFDTILNREGKSYVLIVKK